MEKAQEDDNEQKHPTTQYNTLIDIRGQNHGRLLLPIYSLTLSSLMAVNDTLHGQAFSVLGHLKLINFLFVKLNLSTFSRTEQLNTEMTLFGKVGCSLFSTIDGSVQ